MKHFNVGDLPSQIARTCRRYNMGDPGDVAGQFLNLTYVSEILIKSITVALVKGLKVSAKERAYEYEFNLLRADGLGYWDEVIRRMTSQGLSNYLPITYRALVLWLTQKRSYNKEPEFERVLNSIKELATDLGFDNFSSNKESVLNVISALVYIRNKTKAHGAVNSEFYYNNNSKYFDVINWLVESCPINYWIWTHLMIRENGKPRGLKLMGISENQNMHDNELKLLLIENVGSYIITENKFAIFVGDFLLVDRDGVEFFIPNGGYNDNSTSSEFINYENGQIKKIFNNDYLSKPSFKPPSETETSSLLDVYSNVFGNLPKLNNDYVNRVHLEKAILDKLLDRNHHIITLHGGGGVGKTSLALAVSKHLSELSNCPFDLILWFSARDIDLLISGPKAVHQSIIDIPSIKDKFKEVISQVDSTFYLDLDSVLLDPALINSNGILFIFDNFETVSDALELHKYLDQFTHIPNKILITSRVRAFRADYPIEISGMEYDEAYTMIKSMAIKYRIEHLLSDENIQKLYNATNGHAYAMRVSIGEIDKVKKFINPIQYLNTRDDIINSIFERSFNRLSHDGSTVFLIISNWNSYVYELSLIMVLHIRGIDARNGIEECLRLSLIEETCKENDLIFYSVPQLGKLFGKKKLTSNAHRLVINQDINTLKRFGVLSDPITSKVNQHSIIDKFIDTSFNELLSNPESKHQSDSYIKMLAYHVPQVWLTLAEFRRAAQFSTDLIKEAYTKAVEEMPNNKNAWLKRANYAQSIGDDSVFISSLVSSVEADLDDIQNTSNVAFELSNFLTKNKFSIPKTMRGVYLANVRQAMGLKSHKLDATGLSRLAWLYLLESDKNEAKRFAEMGISKDPNNNHCQRLLAKLDESEYTDED